MKKTEHTGHRIPRRGPKPQERKKALISMTASDYSEFSRWADEDGVTKSVLMHDMIGRERVRRSNLLTRSLNNELKENS